MINPLKFFITSMPLKLFPLRSAPIPNEAVVFTAALRSGIQGLGAFTAAGGLRGLWRKAYRCAAPLGLDSLFLLPTLDGFAGARLQSPPQNAKTARVWGPRGGLNNFAHAALAPSDLRENENA